MSGSSHEGVDGVPGAEDAGLYFGSMTEEEVIARSAIWAEESARKRQEALERLPAFPEEDREKRIIGAYVLIKGLARLRRDNSIEQMVLHGVLGDLFDAYNYILTPEVLTQIHEDL